MSVWFVIPSCRPVDQADACIKAWRDLGYFVAIAREDASGMPYADKVVPVHSYLGWARSVNLLVGNVMADDSDAEWFVTGGDDYYPDPHRRAEDIAAECGEYFANLHRDNYGNDSFGVMQPTGDRWAEGSCTTCKGQGWLPTAQERIVDPCLDCNRSGRSAVIDRICGSPWMGREFCRRMYHGGGPLYNGYYHNFADEELQNVARKLGVFWQRRDIVQEHRHWATKQPKSETHTGLAGDVRNMPEWARKINDPKLSDWERSKALFQKRKASGFPGHEPLEV